MNFSRSGYKQYSETKPQEMLMAECIDEHGMNSWTSQIGPDGGSGSMPYWWRPALSKDDLWRRIVELESIKAADISLVAAWQAEGERLLEGKGGLMFSLGAWWADRPWRDRDA